MLVDYYVPSDPLGPHWVSIHSIAVLCRPCEIEFQFIADALGIPLASAEDSEYSQEEVELRRFNYGLVCDFYLEEKVEEWRIEPFEYHCPVHKAVRPLDISDYGDLEERLIEVTRWPA